MIFKGRTYRRAPMVTILDFGVGSDPHTLFGRVVPRGKPCPPNGVLKGTWKVRDENRNWQDSGDPVYAVPVLCIGHSRTNLSYGADGKMYLALNGTVYTAPYKMNETAKERARLAKEDLRANNKLNPGHPA